MEKKRQRTSSQQRLLPDSSDEEEEQIEGEAMPLPPQNWPQNENQAAESDNLSRDDSYDIENSSGLGACEEQSNQPRDSILMHSGWGKDDGILHVELNDDGQTIGPDASRLSSQLGVLARNGILAPLYHKDWRLVPASNKDQIWTEIKENTDATEDMKRTLMKSIGSKWKEWKHHAKKRGYDQYTNDVERLANCPKGVEEDQWRKLVDFWNSTDAKEKSKRNKESRKKLTMPNTSGRKSRAQTKDEEYMDALGEDHPELNVSGSAPSDVYPQVNNSGIDRTLREGASSSYLKMKETLSEEMKEVINKMFSEAKEDMKAEIDDKIHVGVLRYMDSWGTDLGIDGGTDHGVDGGTYLGVDEGTDLGVDDIPFSDDQDLRDALYCRSASSDSVVRAIKCVEEEEKQKYDDPALIKIARMISSSSKYYTSGIELSYYY